MTAEKTKWFFPIQEKSKKFLEAYFDRYQCDWQDVIEKEGIVYERYSGVTKDNKSDAIIITYLSQSNDFFVYTMYNR